MNEHESIIRRWALCVLINFWVLSVVGVILRYKTVFPLPALHQKNLLHAHSHFAFCGWVGMGLFTGICWILSQQGKVDLRRYRNLFWLGECSCIGMLASFPLVGYHPVSILFSTIWIFCMYAFAYRAWKDIRRTGLDPMVGQWFQAAFLLFILSTFGTFALAYLMMSGGYIQELYIGAVYFFLHFQYNGWFLFCLLGFFTWYLSRHSPMAAKLLPPAFFRLMSLAVVPAYCLSLLWMRIPGWIYALAVLAAVLQVWALVGFIGSIRKLLKTGALKLRASLAWLWGFALLAFVLKTVMQALSAIPFVSHYAFAYRPIVIGYLHLVLLGLVSFFLLGFLIREGLISLERRLGRFGLTLFIWAVVANEAVLMLQGLFAVGEQVLPMAHLILFIISIVLSASVLLIVLVQGGRISSFRVGSSADTVLS